MSSNPYQAPPAGPLSPQHAPASDWHYKSPRVLAILIIIGVLASASLSMLVTILEVVFEAMWPGFNDPAVALPDENSVAAAAAYSGIALLSVLPILAMIVIVPMFSYRSNANARALGARSMEYTPGWSAGFWFIPIVNLFRPFQATRESLLASETLANNSNPSTPVVLGFWWATYLTGNILSNIEGRLVMRGIYDPSWFHLLSFTSSGLTLIAAILFATVVYRMQKSQCDAAEGDNPYFKRQLPVA